MLALVEVGKKQLYLVEYDHFPSDRPFDFLKMTHHQMISCDFIDFKGIPGSKFHNHDEEFVQLILLMNSLKD